MTWLIIVVVIVMEVAWFALMSLFYAVPSASTKNVLQALLALSVVTSLFVIPNRQR